MYAAWLYSLVGSRRRLAERVAALKAYIESGVGDGPGLGVCSEASLNYCL